MDIVSKIHKAAGPDSVVPRILSEFSEKLAPPLTFIFNKSIESGIVPEDWRQANVAQSSRKGKSIPYLYPLLASAVSCWNT